MNLTALNPMQRKVFDLLVLGKTNSEIGVAVHRAEKSIKAYVTAIYKHVGCKSRAELIVRYYKEAA